MLVFKRVTSAFDGDIVNLGIGGSAAPSGYEHMQGVSGWQRLLSEAPQMLSEAPQMLFEAPQMHQTREDLDASRTSLAGTALAPLMSSLAQKLQ